MHIAVVAPSRSLDRDVAAEVTMLAAEASVALTFHPQCFLAHGHFAGSDAERAAAFVEVANDPAVDGVWFARGGYGACRIIDAIEQLTATANAKKYLGYSDAGFLLAALDRRGIGTVAHGPLVNDCRLRGAETARRALGWFAENLEGLEPSGPAVALNATVAASLAGTPHMPDLAGRVLMLEEVAEHDYRFDRSLFQIFTALGGNKPIGVRLGRVSDVPVNDIEFGYTPEDIVRHWCDKAGIAYLGCADIGHDAANKIVPFRAAFKS